MNITLPTSIGEALDKLTILDIKLNKISDARKQDVQNEYDALHHILKPHVTFCHFYYQILKDINLKIWDIQDEFHDSCDEERNVVICREILKENDRRFRVKKKINNLVRSSLKEQKGYSIKKLCILGHLGLGDLIDTIGATRYLSTCYDDIYVICKEQYVLNLELFYADDDSIHIISIRDDNEAYGIIKTMDMHILTCGIYCGRTNFDIIPNCFYEDLGLEVDIFWKYFHIPTTNKATTLLEKVKNIPYVFIHNTSSHGKMFDIKRDELIINPNENMYTKGDEYHELAQQFIGEKLIHYKLIIENAKMNIVTDSSFFSMAINLDIKTHSNFILSRGNRSYDHIWKTSPKKVFKSIESISEIEI